MKNKKIWISLSVTIILIVIVSLGIKMQTKQVEPLIHNTLSSSMQDPFKEEESAIVRAPGSSNYITADVISPNPENMTLTYNGSPILVTYQFQCENPCTMGLLIYVNGILQPYTVTATNEETNMHTVDMDAEDTQQFEFEFTPVCGEKGDQLVVIFANVYNAKVMELTGNVNTFGNNQKVSQPLPWTLQLNADSAKKEFKIATDYQTKTFSEEDKSNFIKMDRDGNRRNQLDDNCYIEIRQKEQELSSRIVLNHSADNNLELYIYGNLTGKYRVSLYGDFDQLLINGQDYIEIDVKKGEYTVIPFTFSAADAGKYKNVFAILAPMEFQNALSKSPSLYLMDK